MKKTWKFVFVAFAFFAFPACSNDDKPTTDSENIESTEESETDINTEMDEDTVLLNNVPMEGEIEEERPPIE
jgi:hypothetical protein